MTKEQIIETTKKFLAEEFEVSVDVIKEDASLQETLDLDSLDYVDLVVIIEENFGFKVEQNDFMDIKTFSDFYGYLEKKLG